MEEGKNENSASEKTKMEPAGVVELDENSASEKTKMELTRVVELEAGVGANGGV